MFKTIVIGLDGSRRCDSAVAAVIGQAAPGARVVAVHAQTHAAEPVQTEVVHEQMQRLRSAGLEVELDGNITVMGDEANGYRSGGPPQRRRRDRDRDPRAGSADRAAGRKRQPAAAAPGRMPGACDPAIGRAAADRWEGAGGR